MSPRANHATSSSADASSSRHSRRWLALTSSGMATASAISSATSSHHNQVGAPSDSAEVGWTEAEVVGDGAAVDSVSVGDVGSSGADDSVRVGSVSGSVGDGAATA